MKRGWIVFILFIFLIVVIAIGLIGIKSTDSGKIRIVAAENVWGNIAKQIGGDQVEIRSIVTDPNADPHEYESSSTDSRAVADSNIAIINGLGYDSWANKLISANPKENRVVIDIGKNLGLKTGDNPHIWYSFMYTVNSAKYIESQLELINPEKKSYYSKNLNNFLSEMNKIAKLEKNISLQFSGAKVASTESLFEYLSIDLNLDLISPKDFMQSVSEGNDPSVSSVIKFTDQLNNKMPKILVYNLQTVTPLTINMKKISQNNNITSVGITEIMPNNLNYQDWMLLELNRIKEALN